MLDQLLMCNMKCVVLCIMSNGYNSSNNNGWKYLAENIWLKIMAENNGWKCENIKMCKNGKMLLLTNTRCRELYSDNVGL